MAVEQLIDIISVVNSQGLKDILFWPRMILAPIGILFTFLILYLGWRYHYYEWAFGLDWLDFSSFHPFGMRRRQKRWVQITKRLEQGKESDYKLAVLEADLFIEEIFKRMGFGDTMEAQLHSAPVSVISNLDALRKAHEMRNSLVHDPDLRLSKEDAQQILNEYGRTLSTLDIL